jgi:hypothetical protein
MASRSKKKPRLSKEKLQQIRNLEVDLKYTLRSIEGKYEPLDLIFTEQANKIRGQIVKVKENQ